MRTNVNKIQILLHNSLYFSRLYRMQAYICNFTNREYVNSKTFRQFLDIDVPGCPIDFNIDADSFDPWADTFDTDILVQKL